MEPKDNSAFAIWITGLPASGKSTVASVLKEQLGARGVHVVVLESDILRKILTPQPRYDAQERDRFYEQMGDLGALLAEQGISVIFDATANRRAYRDYARRQIPHFLEVLVDCPLATCMARDPKGIYHKAGGQVPGLQVPYEPPLAPDLIIHSDSEPPASAALRILQKLETVHSIPNFNAGAT